MKKISVLFAAISFVVSATAQQAANQKPKEIHHPDGSFYKSCAYVKVTKPLTELVAERDARRQSQTPVIPHPAADAGAREQFNHRAHHSLNQSQMETDGALQSVDGTERTANTIFNQDGQTSLTGGYPYDPNGMVSTLYYVQTINSSVEMWNKNGTVHLAQTDLLGLFGTLGDGDCGDPVVMYDKAADRWVITEFEGCENPPSGTVDTLLMAVSLTNDPAGSYYLYAFCPDVNSYDDYPKYHVWGDGYYMTCNCNPDYVVAYQRDSMLLGRNAGMIAMPWNYGPYNLASCGGDFFCPMMLDADGTLPPYGSPEYLFYYWDANWGCGGADSICIEQVKINWNTLTGTINGNFQHLYSGSTPPLAAFNSTFNGGFDNNIPQKGGGNLASADGFFSYRIPYLRWSSYNSCVMVNPVNVGTLANPVSGMRWYELHQDTTTKMWSIYQQSTWAPADGVSRWTGSIAMDYNGDIGLAYSVANANSVYPGLRYTGRRYCDALNTMTLAEGTAVSGNAAISTPQSGGNRWGDYSVMSIDPSDGITFWYTNAYALNGAFGSTNMSSRIFSFQVPSCPLNVNNVSEPKQQLTTYQNGGTLIVKGASLTANERVVVELFDINGKRLMQKEMTPSGSTLETSFNVATLAKAMYIVRLGNDSFQRVVKVTIQ